MTIALHQLSLEFSCTCISRIITKISSNNSDAGLMQAAKLYKNAR